jgi:hypothetical protein
MATTNEDIIVNSLESNISNNIFDSVVEKFDFKRNSSNLWKAQDFISDDIRNEVDVTSNKTKCAEQINKKIQKLSSSLALEDTTDSQKAEIRMWIQKLGVAKIFVTNPTVMSKNSLQIASNIASARNEVARMFGSNPSEWRKNAGALEAGDIQQFMMSQTPRLLIAGIFALLSKLLPSPFKEAALAWIGGITGLGMYKDAQGK